MSLGKKLFISFYGGDYHTYQVDGHKLVLSNELHQFPPADKLFPYNGSLFDILVKAEGLASCLGEGTAMLLDLPEYLSESNGGYNLGLDVEMMNLRLVNID